MNLETPTEAANIEKHVPISDLESFITSNSCPNCNNQQPLSLVSIKAETNCNIIEAIQQLVIYLNKVQSTGYTKWLEQHIPFVCYKNINSLVMIIFYFYGNQIIDIFEQNGQKECIPIFYHINPDCQCTLDIETTEHHSTITIIAKENINIDTMSSLNQPLNLPPPSPQDHCIPTRPLHP